MFVQKHLFAINPTSENQPSNCYIPKSVESFSILLFTHLTGQEILLGLPSLCFQNSPCVLLLVEPKPSSSFTWSIASYWLPPLYPHSFFLMSSQCDPRSKPQNDCDTHSKSQVVSTSFLMTQPNAVSPLISSISSILNFFLLI